MWLQYGGQWGAAGSGCGDINGKAYVSVDGGAEAEWDISSLAQCTSGASCPPTTLNLNTVPGLAAFRVPECDGATTTVTKTAGRGEITIPVHPNAGNGFRGEVEFNDNTFDGREAYSAEVTVSCGGGAPAGVAAGHTYRLACANTIGTGTCHQGRLETLNPFTHEWGSICGHTIWNNDVVANMACIEMGFQSGTVYTYGGTTALPTVPIVAGFQNCAGSEASLFNCPLSGSPLDPQGLNGVDPSCTFSGEYIRNPNPSICPCFWAHL